MSAAVSAVQEIAGLKAYQPQDLERVLHFVGACCHDADFCGALHPGDLGHFLSNTLRGSDPARNLYLYEDDDRSIQAVIVLYPARFGGFDLILASPLRGTAREIQLLSWGEDNERALMQAAGNTAQQVAIDVMDCDLPRQEALRQLGYTAPAAPEMTYTMRSLDVPIPESILPEGFTIRSAAGEHEAALLGAVHSSAFGSSWTGDDYARVMRTPGFDVERELVVVAPDGRFAAFLIYWNDPVTRCGLFEPVGCHADFQRRGLTRALMYEGMRRMRAGGMTWAAVNHLTTNEASAGLYRSVGFLPKYSILRFHKTLQ